MLIYLRKLAISRFSLPISLVGLVAAFLIVGGLPVPAAAATAKWSASLTGISATALTLKPGEEKQVTVTFKNTGGATWIKNGAGYVSLYTWDPKYRASAVQGAGWKSSKQTGPIQANVAPGKTGSLTFNVKAPAVAGSYNEHFQLAAEDTAWIAGGRFAISITVSGKAVATTAPAPTGNPAAASGALAAIKLMTSASSLTLHGGEKADFNVLYKNTGSATWAVRKLVAAEGVRLATDAPTFFDSSWSSQTVALAVAEAVAPGRTAYVRFSLRAPSTHGQYSAKFKLVVDDADVPGGDFEIPITVTDDAPSAPNSEPGPGSSVVPVSPSPLASEPKIRVGLDHFDIKSLIFSSTGPLNVTDANGNSLGTIAAGANATLNILAPGSFELLSGGARFQANGIMRLLPDTGDENVTKVSTLEPWSSWVNGARFRGILEIRYYAPADATWLIEEVGFEKYMYGLAEMSNGSPYEYQKALVTAARTYAYWHLTHPGKHVTFTVDSSLDQVYRGYNRELAQPNTVRAVNDTRGQIVHYAGVPVVTPYYANSDGRTRAWTEVWGGGAKPWLVSVPAIYDKGKTLWGHGVGMSARDAAYRADNDGWTWDQLIKYYYTGVELKQLW